MTDPPINAKKAGRPKRCVAHPDGRHRWAQKFTAACQHKWQWQNVCDCTEVRDDGVYGTPPADFLLAQRQPTPQPAKVKDLDLDDPAAVACIVESLFDHNLNWTRATAELMPHLNESEAFEQAGKWATDKRVTDAIGEMIRSLSSSSPDRAALLLYHSWKYAADSEETAAVRATALNILKAAHITERSEQQQHQHIKITGLPDILAGIGVAPQPNEEKELVN